MRTWTLEERYRVLKDEAEIKDLYNQIKNSKYRQNYHIQPITGLLSDPNGFIHHNDQWHLFYQWCPWGAVHGLKYWYHVSSPDLVHWKNEGIGLKPDSIYDNKGTHSGSAFTDNEKIYLFYTGNHRDEDWIRTPYTCLAIYDEKINKLDSPLFGPHADYTEHQRDPKILFNKDLERYFIFIGAQDKDLKGCILVYSSKDLDKGWRFEGPLKVDGIEDLGGMWECPSIVNIGDKDLLIFSPQYIKLPNRNESTNHNIYILGKMDYETLTFYPDTDYEFLDYGFDFYAAQVAYDHDDSNDPILIGWIGLPDNHYPTEEEDWEGSLSLPRVLKIKDNHLIQYPVLPTEELERVESKDCIPRSCFIKVDLTDDNDFYLDLFTLKNKTGGLKIKYDSNNKKIIISKDELIKHFNDEIGTELEVPLFEKLDSLDIFIDSNSIEIFFDKGTRVFTSHIYPTDEECYLNFSPNLKIEVYNIDKTNKNNFEVFN